MASIFLSSTLADLREYRAAAKDALEKLGYTILAEELQADPQTPWQIMQSRIAQCDFFVSIVAWRYGFVPPGDNAEQHSYVELEFDYARELKKPTFVFLADEDFGWSPQQIDSGPQQQLLRAFRDKLKKLVTVGFFSTPADLAIKLVAALQTWLRPPDSKPPPNPEPLAIPPGVDSYELAWRLVASSKAEPALLLHMDATAIQRALEKWASENRPAGTPVDPTVYQVALQALRQAQPNLTPSPLWLAWMKNKQVASSAEPPPSAT
jgi:Domain of unknown function (DUF4062)